MKRQRPFRFGGFRAPRAAKHLEASCVAPQDTPRTIPRATRDGGGVLLVQEEVPSDATRKNYFDLLDDFTILEILAMFITPNEAVVCDRNAMRFGHEQLFKNILRFAATCKRCRDIAYDRSLWKSATVSASPRMLRAGPYVRRCGKVVIDYIFEGVSEFVTPKTTAVDLHLQFSPPRHSAALTYGELDYAHAADRLARSILLSQSIVALRVLTRSATEFISREARSDWFFMSASENVVLPSLTTLDTQLGYIPRLIKACKRLTRYSGPIVFNVAKLAASPAKDIVPLPLETLTHLKLQSTFGNALRAIPYMSALQTLAFRNECDFVDVNSVLLSADDDGDGEHAPCISKLSFKQCIFDIADPDADARALRHILARRSACSKLRAISAKHCDARISTACIDGLLKRSLVQQSPLSLTTLKLFMGEPNLWELVAACPLLETVELGAMCIQYIPEEYKHRGPGAPIRTWISKCDREFTVHIAGILAMAAAGIVRRDTLSVYGSVLCDTYPCPVPSLYHIDMAVFKDGLKDLSATFENLDTLVLRVSGDGAIPRTRMPPTHVKFVNEKYFHLH